MNKEMTSAKANDAHSMVIPKSLFNMYANGKITNNWRHTDMIKLYIPSPNAWYKEDKTIPTAAKGNDNDIKRNAGTPILSISEEALNIINNLSGIAKKIAIPIVKITAA